MKAADRLKLTPWQTLSHYGPAPFMWLVCFMWVCMSISNNKNLADIANEELPLMAPFLLAALAITIIQYRRLRFIEFDVAYTPAQFDEAVKRTVSDLKWRIEQNNKSILIAYRPSNWTSSWGEMITIKKQSGSLLLNSICSPNERISVSSYGWNKKNLVTFMYHLGDAINNKPHVAPPVLITSEWSAKRIVTRIFLYPLALFLILLALYFLFTPASYGRGLFAALSAAALAVTYLYMDIKMIMGKGE